MRIQEYAEGGQRDQPADGQAQLYAREVSMAFGIQENGRPLRHLSEAKWLPRLAESLQEYTTGRPTNWPFYNHARAGRTYQNRFPAVAVEGR